MRQYLAVILVLTFFISGCSVLTKRSGKSNQSNESESTAAAVGGTGNVAQSGIPFVTDRSRPVEKAPVQRESTAKNEPEPSETPIALEMAEPAVLETPADFVKFGSNDTQHIRLANYNPFENTDKLKIDLSELKGKFCYPYNGKVISNYGYRGRSMHTGVDIKATPNDTIRCVMDGVVRMSKPYSGYGNVVVVRHANGLETVYSHQAKNLVSPNDVLKAGDPIGLAGRTGRATTEHVHFEVRVMGEHFNPHLLLDTDNHCLNQGTLNVSRRNGRIFAVTSSGKGGDAGMERTLAAEPEAKSVSTRTATASRAAAPTVSKATGGSVHTVRKGDTLYSIAKNYGTTVASICSLNGIAKTKTLSIGMKLKVK